ncbi:FAD-dependent monooxygenase [Actinoplanes couchii]|uniref:FAD-dependent oxidoreductase n=1 Tax=Actinoplanes couchii TaxID=403638 RepID=A0ABQ3XL73_9ACTN|nr:FAD-dependent monooxygenase [Actinoplanes couchii]MDR6318398.1 2-polyprenyl-6-methoxyphenol hydroxylase-like FAD-dependent oxidoreductase [Actinoplanes couchii]GID59236.1 FAD-dependent oxidoreductase [Actinoplanes couchii]
MSKRALVVGAGITGVATAIRLRQIGWEPVMVERAAQRRGGGYFIMLFGTGKAAAGRLGVLDAIGTRSGSGATSYTVDRDGRRSPAMMPSDLPGEPRMLLRGDIERALFSVLPADVEVRYATVPTAITQDETGAQVTLLDQATGVTRTEKFDLVVGADGMRSTVRELVFGDDLLHPLGFMIGACLLDRPLTGFGMSEGLWLNEPGRSAIAFSFADRPSSLMFTYRADDSGNPFAGTPIENLRSAFGPAATGPILGELLDRYEEAPDVLFDSVNQVRMPRWHDGRVVLAGDAAWCLTLYSGMGASTGMAGADLLGTMLARHDGDIGTALKAWETRLRPHIEEQQAQVHADRLLFIAKDDQEYAMRTQMMQMAATSGGLPGNTSFDSKNRDISG